MVRDSPARGRANVTENVLAPFADAWKPLDPQVAFVLSIIYSRAIAQGIKPLNEMPPAEARDVVKLMQFYLGAGAPAIPHIEERSSSPRAVRFAYGSTIPARRRRRPPSSSCMAAAGSCATSTSTTASRASSRSVPDCASSASTTRSRPSIRFRSRSTTVSRRCAGSSRTARRNSASILPASPSPAIPRAPISRSRPASSCANPGRSRCAAPRWSTAAIRPPWTRCRPAPMAAANTSSPSPRWNGTGPIMRRPTQTGAIRWPRRCWPTSRDYRHSIWPPVNATCCATTPSNSRRAPSAPASRPNSGSGRG